MEIQELNRSRAELEKIIAGYQKRLEDAPLNEQQYNALLRESNMAKMEYEEMSKRHDASETAQSLEEHKAGENLEVLDPAIAAGAAVRAEPPGVGRHRHRRGTRPGHHAGRPPRKCGTRR